MLFATSILLTPYVSVTAVIVLTGVDVPVIYVITPPLTLPQNCAVVPEAGFAVENNVISFYR